MGNNQKKEEVEETEDFNHRTMRIHYEGEWYLLIQYGDLKLVLMEVEENGRISYQAPLVGVREKLLELRGLDTLLKIQNIENAKVEISPKISKKKLRFIASLLFSVGVLAFVFISKYNKNNFNYTGMSYEQLLDKLPDDSLDLQTVLNEYLCFENSEHDMMDGCFSDLEKEEFRNRAKRFASYLTEDEQEIFKYQLSRISIQKGRNTIFVESYIEGKYILYIEGNVCECGIDLEYIFCEMMQNCYIEKEKDYFIFNNQKFPNSTRVDLGDHFPFYNNTLFIYTHYPEYQERLSQVLESEGSLYYQLVLQTLDANLVYLPFNYQMEDVLKAYQEIFPSKDKVEDFIGQVGVVQSFENQGNFWDYDVRNSVVVLSNEYFIEREEQIADQYFTSILKEGKSNVSTQELIEELSNRYRKYSSLIEQINENSEVKFNSIYDFKRDYSRKVLSLVYVLGSELEMIPEDMTYEELKYSFFDRVYAEENNNNENIDGSLEIESGDIYQKIFRYPLSTQ